MHFVCSKIPFEKFVCAMLIPLSLSLSLGICFVVVGFRRNFFFCYGHSVLRMFIFWRYQCSLSLSLVYKFNDIYISNGSFKYLIKTSKQEKAAAAVLSWLWHAAAGGNGFGGTVFVLKQLSKWNGLLNLHTFRWSTTYTVFKSDFYSSAAKIICRKIWHRIRNEEEFCVFRENSFSGIRMIIIILLSSFKVFNIHEMQYMYISYIHTYFANGLVSSTLSDSPSFSSNCCKMLIWL